MASGAVSPGSPGWYADPAGVEGRWRWWDGQRWTEAVRDAAEPAVAESAAEAGDGAAAAGQGRWWLVAAVVVALVVVGGAAVVVVAGGSSSDEAGGGAADEVSAQGGVEEGAGQAGGEVEQRGAPDAGQEGAASVEGADGGEALQGVIRDAEHEPVEGVEVLVVDDDGVAVSLGVADGEGQWFVPLPGPGSYTATLVEESLTPGVGLRDPERGTLDVRVAEGQQRSVLFVLR